MGEEEDQHALLDRLEHDLRSMEFNRPYEVIEIRKLQNKVLDLKNKLQESELAFGQA
jgi:branched-subunit amino acid aminotransferase/4-amino-4-deoxychorismate lyase